MQRRIERLSERTSSWFGKDIYPELRRVRTVGSVTLKSDDDHASILPYTPGECTELSGKGTNKYRRLIQAYQRLVEKVNTSALTYEGPTTDGETRFDFTYTHMGNALKALRDVGYSWKAAIEKYADCDPQILIDIREVEKRFTYGFSVAVGRSFLSVNQADWVRLLNEAARAVFGKEMGSLFDTNYYMSGTQMFQGIQFHNVTLKEAFMHINRVQALSKLIKYMSEETGSVEAAAEKLEANMGGYDRESIREAMNHVKAQEFNIESKRETLSGIDGLSEEEANLMAMNMLYEEFLKEAQVAYNQREQCEQDAYREIDLFFEAKERGESSATFSTEKERLKEAFKLGTLMAYEEMKTSSEFEELLRKLEDHRERYEGLTVHVYQLEAQAVLYANEPYYSTATVNIVVGGIQVKKADKDPEKIKSLKADYPLLQEPETWLDSAIENLGDYLKAKHHAKGDLKTFMIKDSKYLYRCLFSLEQALLAQQERRKDFTMSPLLRSQLEQLKETSAVLLRLRESEDLELEKKMGIEIVRLGIESESKTPEGRVAQINALYQKVETLVMLALQEGRHRAVKPDESL